MSATREALQQLIQKWQEEASDYATSAAEEQLTDPQCAFREQLRADLTARHAEELKALLADVLGSPRSEKDEKDQETRVDDSQYDRPFATASGNVPVPPDPPTEYDRLLAQKNAILAKQRGWQKYACHLDRCLSNPDPYPYKWRESDRATCDCGLAAWMSGAGDGNQPPRSDAVDLKSTPLTASAEVVSPQPTDALVAGRLPSNVEVEGSLKIHDALWVAIESAGKCRICGLANDEAHAQEPHAFEAIDVVALLLDELRGIGFEIRKPSHSDISALVSEIRRLCDENIGKAAIWAQFGYLRSKVRQLLMLLEGWNG